MPGGQAQCSQAEVPQHIFQSGNGVEEDAVGQHVHRRGDFSGQHTDNIGQQQCRNEAALGQEFDELMPRLVLLPVKAQGEQQKQRRQYAHGEADR